MNTGKSVTLLFVVLCVTSFSTRATDDCTFGVKPETSGFTLNPILDRVTVTSARPTAPGKTCSLKPGDQILRVNQQTIPGQRALKVMRYWKAIPDGTPATLVVKRGDTTFTVSTR